MDNRKHGGSVYNTRSHAKEEGANLVDGHTFTYKKGGLRHVYIQTGWIKSRLHTNKWITSFLHTKQGGLSHVYIQNKVD